MTQNLLLLPIFIPFIAALLAFSIPKRLRAAGEILALSATLFGLLVTIFLFNKNFSLSLPWAGFGFEFLLRLYHFSAFLVLSIAGFGFLVTLYSTVFMRHKACANQFYAFLLLTLSFASGAVLADNLVLMLFFWEGSLLALFGMIAIGNSMAFKTATKAFIIVGIADLCMLTGIALTGHLAGTLTISRISLPLGGLGSLAFILLMIGAISKGGSMPFHSWIPDAAQDAPLPFMALVPASLEKILGVYLLTRISLDMFRLNPGSWVSIMLMVIGAATLLFAVMMALIQKELKRLLSYHAISQVGYMILGIGTCVPAGIVGGLFHMINNALYKNCLFLSGGSVEKQAQTTQLKDLGGIGKKMPITLGCFLIAAVSISGVPPFNGFFSKELIYDGALERGMIFYIIAVLGSFFTAASFLKLGHAAFFGKISEKNKDIREVPFAMLFPMLVIASLCVIFGVCNFIPLRHLIQPILPAARLEGLDFSGFPVNAKLVLITLIVLSAAILNHIFGVRFKGSAHKASDHIHDAPVLSWIYDLAERRFFDPYDIGLKAARLISEITFWFDRKIDWIYDVLSVNLALKSANLIRRLHNGNYATYLAWSLLGFGALVVFLIFSV
ncbi:MAG: proton-conducting transporter membrane subunit [Candidatus Omnitrophica bacterium]|nr:proton-conducting transporter membrane subunit [Candidatus Omnitrophota bacterium]